MRAQPNIPNKLYFRIGEVADLLAIKPYVLRYWETEFPDIKPSKSKSGQRLYKRRDVDLLMKIKDLLYQERFTINGARKRLRELIREQRGSDGPMPEEFKPVPSPLKLAPAPTSTPTPPPVAMASRSPSLDSRKILLKIRKDLQSVLEQFK